MSQLFGIARVGNDPELRYTPNGHAVIKLSLAFNYGRKGDDGKRPTTWVDAALWGKQAEALAPHLAKGTQLCVTVRDVRLEEFQRRDGGSGSKIAGDIAAIEFAGPKPEGGQPRQQAPRPAPQSSAKPAQDYDSFDDIPF